MTRTGIRYGPAATPNDRRAVVPIESAGHHGDLAQSTKYENLSPRLDQNNSPKGC